MKTVLNIFPISFPITYLFWGPDSSNCYGAGVEDDPLSLGGGVDDDPLSLGGGVDDALSLGVDEDPLSLGAADAPPSLLETELSVDAGFGLAGPFPAAALILAHASGSSRTA